MLEPTGLLAPLGVPGELCIGGVGVARGYRNRPELTAEKFVTLELQPGNQSASTALATWRAGVLMDSWSLSVVATIRSRCAASASSSARSEVALVRIRRFDTLWSPRAKPGPSDLRLVAYVVYQQGEDLTVSEVRRHLRGELPDYMIPSLVVALDAIPLTPNGKVDRAALPDPFKGAAMASATDEPPAPGMEQLLARIWSDVLKIERIGAQDNFFELGHSPCRWASRRRQRRSPRRMDPRVLFFPTAEPDCRDGQ